MRPFDYVRAGSTGEATAVAAEGTAYIAGGTNLLDLMKLEVMAPDRLVDINRLDLDGVEPTVEGGLRIGALVRNSDLAADPVVRRDYQLLARALLAGASGQLRQGDDRRQPAAADALLLLLRHGDPCNKRVPGRAAAIDGFNRIHAILGASELHRHASERHGGGAAGARRPRRDRGRGRDPPHPARRTSTAPRRHARTGRRCSAGRADHRGPATAADRRRQIYRKVRDRSSYAFAWSRSRRR